jgi:microcystin-dependent protein
MSDQFLAEIRMFGCNFAPKGWAQCNGQLLPISQNTALFSLLGTFYGGDGKSTFGLPNLEGSVPIEQGQGAGLSDRFLGETGGEPSVTLLVSEMPAHNHTAFASTNVASPTSSPAGNVWGALPGRPTPPSIYAGVNPNTQMNPLALQIAGSSLPHNNMSPYLCVNFCIAMQGVFPPRQ